MIKKEMSWLQKRPIWLKNDKIVQNQIDFVPTLGYYIFILG